MFGARHGAVTDALRAAADSLGVQLPRGLWHAVSFHTSGELVRHAAAEFGVEHTPYWVRAGIFRDYQRVIEEQWQPYLDGERELDRAALELVSALPRQ